MKIKLLFGSLFFSVISYSQIVNIPNANFKSQLLSANSSNTIAKD